MFPHIFLFPESSHFSESKSLDVDKELTEMDKPETFVRFYC